MLLLVGRQIVIVPTLECSQQFKTVPFLPVRISTSKRDADDQFIKMNDNQILNLRKFNKYGMDSVAKMRMFGTHKRTQGFAKHRFADNYKLLTSPRL